MFTIHSQQTRRVERKDLVGAVAKWRAAGVLGMCWRIVKISACKSPIISLSAPLQPVINDSVQSHMLRRAVKVVTL